MKDPVIEKEEQKSRVKPPSLYNVIFLNDDFTSTDFVVAVLVQLFGYSQEKSSQIMSTIHTKGEGIAGTYPKDIAETKSSRVNDAAQQEGFPLRTVVKEL